jgi:membrane dipeptidase
MDVGPGRTIASHSNVRSIVDARGPLLSEDRHLTDDMIKAIGDLDGVVGLNLFNAFLTGEWEGVIVAKMLTQLHVTKPTTPFENFVTLEVVRAHAEHIASLIGWHRVGIGSDLDGGLGRDETPVELDTAADLAKIGDVVPADARAGVLGENWLRLLREALPA